MRHRFPIQTPRRREIGDAGRRGDAESERIVHVARFDCVGERSVLAGVQVHRRGDGELRIGFLEERFADFQRFDGVGEGGRVVVHVPYRDQERSVGETALRVRRDEIDGELNDIVQSG